MKRCSNCRSAKPETEFYRDARAPDSLKSQCKVCHCAGAKSWSERNKDKRNSITARYRKKNPDVCRRALQRWRARSKDYEKAKRREWEANNPGWALRYADRRKVWGKRWKAANKDAVLVHSSNRRARLRGAIGRHTKQQIAALYAEQNGLCANPRCRTPLGDDFHRDHVQPVSCGGSNDISNIQLLCPPCNTRKGARDMKTFMERAYA